jgi:hypothetical protein
MRENNIKRCAKASLDADYCLLMDEYLAGLEISPVRLLKELIG